MATIHKKESIIKHRQNEWSPKNKKKAKARDVVKTIWSGMKIIGGKIAAKASDPKFQQSMGDFGRNAGNASRDMWGKHTPKRKHKKSKKKSSKKRR